MRMPSPRPWRRQTVTAPMSVTFGGKVRALANDKTEPLTLPFATPN
jgi:hypothetical protein